jgi:hypothetical protein
MGAHVLLLLAVKSKSERKVDLLPQLRLEPVTFGTQVHISHTARPSPTGEEVNWLHLPLQDSTPKGLSFSDLYLYIPTLF